MRRVAVTALAGAACVLTLAAPLAMAQSVSDLSNLTSEGAPPPTTLTLTPSYPQPYGTATLSVQSTTLSLGNATLAVSVNGKSVYQGNVQPVTITIGAPGVATTISTTVTSQGQSYPTSMTIDPGDVSLVEEPLASVPPLYPGKPLVPLSGQVRLVAIAGFATAAGTPINPNTLSYTWTEDGSVLGSASGIGRSSVVVAAPLEYRASDISVSITTQDGVEQGGGSVSLSPQDPSVRIYASDPLLGILFDHALAGPFAITGTEASFYAAPYSFATSNGAPAINWFLNGASAGNTNSVTLRPTGTGSGNGTLSVSVSESGLYENATADLPLSFGSSGSTNFLGL